MATAPRVSPGETDPGTIIADERIRELYCKFLDAICGFHDDVKLRTSRMETRVFFGDTFLCRVVAYRQLFHVVVGNERAWETRVRDPDGCADALDRVLSRFLDTYAKREAG